MSLIFIDIYNMIKVYTVIKMFKWKITKSYHTLKRNSDMYIYRNRNIVMVSNKNYDDLANKNYEKKNCSSANFAFMLLFLFWF